MGILLSVLMVWDRERRFALVASRWCWGSLFMWLNPFLSVERRGVERAAEGPYIIVANHQSVTDIPCVVGLPLPVRIVAREGVAKVPVLGTFLRLARHLVADDDLLQRGQASLDAGISLLIFPEGTRSVDGSLRRFRGGAFHLAEKTGAKLLPVVVDGGRFAVPKGRWRPDFFPVPLRLQVLDPVDPADFDSPLALRKAVQASMREALTVMQEGDGAIQI